MQCEEVRNYFADQLIGALDASSEPALLQHLAGCEACRTEFDGLRNTWSQLQVIPVPEPDSAAMYEKIVTTFYQSTNRAHPEIAPGTVRRFNMRQAAKPLGLIAASIIAVVAATVFFSRCGVTLGCPVNHSENTGPAVASKAGPAEPVHMRGADTATVTLTEYGDYECPPCSHYQLIVTRLLQEFPDRLKLEWHHFPLSTIHRNALLAAKAAEAAGDQDHYWEMHDLLFTSQPKWSRSTDAEREFIAMANQIGLDGNLFIASLHSSRTEQRVLADAARGRDLRINGTPTFFINGRRVDSLPGDFEAFAKLIAAAANQN